MSTPKKVARRRGGGCRSRNQLAIGGKRKIQFHPRGEEGEEWTTLSPGARRSRELFIASIARHRFPLPLPNAARRIVKAGWVIRNWLETERARSAGGGRGGEKEWGAFSSSKVNAAEVLARREEEGWMERKGRNIAACLLCPPLCIRLAFRIYISFRFVLLLYIFRVLSNGAQTSVSNVLSLLLPVPRSEIRGWREKIHTQRQFSDS